VIFLCLLFLGACKLQEESVSPIAELDEGKINQLKNWFGKKNQYLKSGQAYWDPQWGDGLLHTLNDGSQIAVFPIWREASVQYYDIGYVRRLVVKLDAEGEIISGKMLEMVGNKEYLHTYKDELPPSFYNGTLQSTGVIAWEREFDSQGFNSQKIGTTTNYTCTTRVEVSGCDVIIAEVCTNRLGEEVSRVVLIASNYEDNCPGSGGTTPLPTGGGGGGTGSPSNPSNNPPSEPNPNGPQGATPVFTDFDGSPILPDRGDNTIDVPIPEEPINEHIKIDISVDEYPKLKCVLEKMLDNSVFKEITNISATQGVDIVYEVGVTDNPVVNAGTRDLIASEGKIVITFNESRIEGRGAMDLARTTLHETLHAMFFIQQSSIGGYQNLSDDNFPDLFWAYTNYPPVLISNGTYDHNTPHHNLMATDTYLNIIANGIKEYDPTKHEETTFEMYVASAWAGLQETDRWINQLSAEEQTNIIINGDNLKMYTILGCE
jgi:hypothetical protein